MGKKLVQLIYEKAFKYSEEPVNGVRLANMQIKLPSTDSYPLIAGKRRKK